MTRSRWRFGATAGSAHDVKLRAPGAGGAPSQLETLTAFAAPNSPPVSKTFTQTGTWTFICTLHSTYNAVADTWTGMVGTAVVAPAQASGVDYTESRVDGGAWGKGTSATVSAPGRTRSSSARRTRPATWRRPSRSASRSSGR